MLDEEAERTHKALSDWAGQMIDRFSSIVNPVVNVFRQAYNDVGMPYGDSDEGFLRWLEDLEQHLPNYRK